ncbi:hypothetical protein ACOMHN_005725 [Nucella lapillus]
MVSNDDDMIDSCWERKRHVVAIKVIVIDSFNKELKNYITYGGFGLAIIASLIACCYIFAKKNRRATAK